MGVTVDKPYFQIRKTNYFVIYDPPHLIKSIRNNLLKYNFEYGFYVAKWNDIKNFYRQDEKQKIRLAPKLTEKHFNLTGFSKMKVKLATQVLSHTVAAAIYTYVSLQGLPGSAVGTAQLLETFDKIFDCCNSSSFTESKFCRRPITTGSPHVRELENVLSFIQSIKVINPANNEDRISQLKCLDGWCITIKSILSLWEKLNTERGISYLLTRQLNQDPLENFFGCIRQQGGCSDNPTPVQFIQAYRKLFHTNLLSVVSGNCEQDKDVLMVTLQGLGQRKNIFETVVPTKPIQIISTDYASEGIQRRLVQSNAVAYMAGYLLRKTYEKHKCCKCSVLSTKNFDCSENTFISLKAFDTDSSMFGGLVAPSEICQPRFSEAKTSKKQKIA
eukprot:gene8345-9246_t